MLSVFSKIITFLYYILFFATPLLFYTRTSELFEFNKMVFVYLMTILIFCAWTLKSAFSQKISVRKNPLNTAFIIFLISSVISTFFSIDFRTSFFGYYSRFHGGLLSSICYILLFLIFVSTMKRRQAITSLKVMLFSSFFVCIYAVLQHFGIDKNIWVQDVQTRVFSTLGQPNWLAAWLSSLISFTWVFFIKNKGPKKYFWLILYFIQLLSLSYTKSKSGFLGFSFSFIFFWVVTFVHSLNSKNQNNTLKKAGCVLLATAIFLLFTGTPWTKGLEKDLFPDNEIAVTQTQNKPAGTSIETGGTDSGKIRLLVWKGAFEAFKNYPIIGSGVETFAFVFYKFRPVEHNMVSEWDFLYNKAHNEYLNILSTTGLVGIISYLFLLFSILLFFANPHSRTISSGKKNISTKSFKYGKNCFQYLSDFFRKSDIFSVAFLSAFLSIIITNFFGFSVVCIGILFFLLPALAVVIKSKNNKKIIIGFNQTKILTVVSLALTIFLIKSLSNYWFADYYYTKGKLYNDIGEYEQSSVHLNKSIKLIEKEAVYWDELARTNAQISQYFIENNSDEKASTFAQLSYSQSLNAIFLSKANVNLKRNMAANLVDFSSIDNQYLVLAEKTLRDAVLQSPNDPKLIYNLGLVYIRMGNLDQAKNALEKAVFLKKDYRSAYFGLGLVYWDLQEKEKAKQQFEYILDNINPNDNEVKRQLEELLQGWN